MIRKAKPNDLKRIIEITKACAAFMISNNIFQWNEHYPNIATFKNDLKEESLYVIEKNEKVIGCIVISQIMDEFYRNVNWITSSEKNLYLHRLAIHPKFQKMVFAKQLMNFSFDFAQKNNFVSIRLDTFSGNPSNKIFYTKLGFKKLGEKYFRKHSD